MSERTPILLVGAIAAVALLISVIGLNSSSDEQAVGGTDGPGAASGTSTSTLEERVATLEAEVVSLRAELKERPPRRDRKRRGEASPSDEEIARRIGRATVRDQPGGRDALIEALDEGDPEVEDRIGALVKDQMEEQREERWERRQERFEERSRERVDRLADSVGLDAGQIETLNNALQAERQQTFTLFRAAREDHTWGEAREKADAIRAETDSTVSESLNATQMDAWQEMREDEQSRHRGGR
jgi:hypothetical protein